MKKYHKPLRFILREARFVAFSKLKEYFERKLKEVEYSNGPGLEYNRPSKIEKEETKIRLNVGIWIFLMLSILTVLIFVFGKYLFSVYNNPALTFEEWNSSAGSFWGAIVGSLVAGVVTASTTILVIQRSYKVDYHRERLESMPLFALEPVCINQKFSDVKKMIKENKIPQAVLDILHGGTAPDETVNICMLKNIGKGIAYTMSTQGLWEEYEEEGYGSIIPVDSAIWIALPIFESDNGMPSYDFSITFGDIYANLYRQDFIARVNNMEMVQTLTTPPELIRKTSRIRYVQ